MIYALYLAKRFVEDIFIFPFICIGRVIALYKPLDKEYRIFFFFPFYHLGGAEKVHAQIANATGGADCIIFFTKKSANDLFFQEFAQSGCVLKDLSEHTDNKWLYFKNLIYRGIISGYINKQKKQPIVFNGQCNFGYKISPWVNKRIIQIELIHSLCSFSYIRIPFLPFITKTVMISKVRIQDHLDLYKRYGIPDIYGTRIHFIMNAIELPSANEKIIDDSKLKALYVGRSTPEKRVHLIAHAAKQLLENKNNVSIQFLGEVKEAIPKELHEYCHFFGPHSDATVIENIYQQAHVLLLVSDTEGFPMVIMEAMARGLAIITTSVGEIPLHVKDGINGFLIKDYLDEKKVIQQIIYYIKKLDQDRALLHNMAATNLQYAHTNFGMTRFNKEYQQLFTGFNNE